MSKEIIKKALHGAFSLATLCAILEQEKADQEQEKADKKAAEYSDIDTALDAGVYIELQKLVNSVDYYNDLSAKIGEVIKWMR